MTDHFDEKAIESTVKKFGGKKDALLAILQEIQREQGSLTEEAVLCLSEKLDIPSSQIFGVASYYSAFSIQPRGRHLIKVCDGTSCHLKGGEKLLNRLGRELKVAERGTTEDLRFTVEKVRCQGCCQLGPVVKIDEVVHGPVTQEKALKLIEEQK